MYPLTYGGKNGTTYQLTESRDLVVVRTREAVALRRSISSQARAALLGMMPVAAFPEANVTVYKCIGTPAHSAEVFRIGGSAQFNKESNVPLTVGEGVGTSESAQRFLGFQLQIEPFHPGTQFQYKVLVRNIGVATGESGAFCGTRDKRRSVVGISCELQGELAEHFDVEYAVRCRSEKDWQEAKNGGWTGSRDKKKGNSVEAVKVKLVKRPD